jgi:peptidyl-tRNA hydrolase
VEFKQVIVVRKDLRMGVGKIAAQVGHAAVLGVDESKKFDNVWVRRWLNEGQPKIVVKVNSLEELLHDATSNSSRQGPDTNSIRNYHMYWYWSCSIGYYR